MINTYFSYLVVAPTPFPRSHSHPTVGPTNIWLLVSMVHWS